jgi:hypothetical protein
MPRLVLVLMLLLGALPAGAQSPATPPQPVAAQVLSSLPPLPEMPRISAGHAAALGTGLFAGAVAGSVLINGGAFAAAIGAVAGVLVGNWYWTEHHEAQD